MILIKETQGDTLHGVIDGSNVTYTTSYAFYDDVKVNIYVNGRLKVRSWDDGFTVVLPNQVVLKEPLQIGDSLEVEYYSGAPTGGGADGGCPNAPEIVILEPVVDAEQDLSEVGTTVMHPDNFSDDLEIGVFSDELKPVIFLTEEG